MKNEPDVTVINNDHMIGDENDEVSTQDVGASELTPGTVSQSDTEWLKEYDRACRND